MYYIIIDVDTSTNKPMKKTSPSTGRSGNEELPTFCHRLCEDPCYCWTYLKHS